MTDEYRTISGTSEGYYTEKRSKFLAFAASKDGLRPKSAAEWASEKEYMMTAVRALVGRYSKLGDDAFYHIYLAIDNVYAAAVAAQGVTD